MRRLMVVGAVLGLFVAACSSDPAELSGFVRTPFPDVSHATLPDASVGGTDFAMQAPAGEILVVYFGYTSCPDVCPTTLADLRSALRKMGDDASRVKVAMATIDPGRDTADIITGYVQSFVPAAHALRTDDDSALRAAADTFGADYGVSISDEGEYDVIHTAHLYAVDDAGQLQVTWPFGTEPEAIALDLDILLRSE
ncbi:MAG: SCO family protein [Actinomycetota bacterium]|nr:SCO family protein [Actinomycetota bacterium]